MSSDDNEFIKSWELEKNSCTIDSMSCGSILLDETDPEAGRMTPAAACMLM